MLVAAKIFCWRYQKVTMKNSFVCKWNLTCVLECSESADRGKGERNKEKRIISSAKLMKIDHREKGTD